jgi:predicted amidohydrolase
MSVEDKRSLLKLACVQLNSGTDMSANIEAVRSFGRAAAEDGAELIAFPENLAMIISGVERKREMAFPEERHPAVKALGELARETGAWVLGGSISVTVSETHLANRSLLFSPEGRIAARYDKLHLFDVDLPGGESYRESETIRPGDAAVLADTPWGGLGMTICYDLRFPHLFRGLAKAGARVLAVPAAFTRQTGRAHWHVLLRARAIEAGCFVIAPAQCGEHDAGRKTYGHSLIVSPWGQILADGGEEPGIISATLDLSEVEAARAAIPALAHDRDFAVETAPQGVA